MKNIFMGKSCRKWTSKASLRPFFILVNNPKQPLHARNSFETRYFERGLSKTLKKVNFIFSSKPSPFWCTKLSKTKGAWNWWPIALQVTKKVQKNSFISYILSDQVYWCNIRQLLSYFKNYIYKSLIIPLRFALLYLESVERKWKITKNWISQEWTELFRWNIKHFS